MITGIDHIVILVQNLDAAMEDYARLGFTVERGGEHPAGTHNALIALADGSYLELIAFMDPAAATNADHPWHAVLTHGEGLVAFALGVSDLAGDSTALRGRGLAVSDAADGSRLRPDGATLTWRAAGIGTGPRGRERPFLIEDVTPRDQRVATGRFTRHANGVIGLRAVTLAVANLDTALADFAKLLDRPTPETTLSESREVRSGRFVTPRGDIIVAHGQAGSAEGIAAGTRGDCLFALTLAVRLQGGEVALSPERAHGVAFRTESV